MSYGDAFGWAVVVLGFTLAAAWAFVLLADSLGRQTMLYVLGPVIGFFAACALIAVPIWLLT
jgi:hypothetical protein